MFGLFFSNIKLGNKILRVWFKVLSLKFFNYFNYAGAAYNFGFGSTQKRPVLTCLATLLIILVRLNNY